MDLARLAVTRSSTTQEAIATSRLLQLPPELRLMIYDHYVGGDAIEISSTTGDPKAFALTSVCHLIHREFKPVLRKAVMAATEYSAI
jgi:hypothetical protein